MKSIAGPRPPDGSSPGWPALCVLPVVLALIVVLSARQQSAVGVAVTITTVMLLLSGPLLGEGLVHLVFDVTEDTTLARWLYRLPHETADGARWSGLAALARAMEHLHLGWALSLPPVRHFPQLCADAFGAGPRPSRKAPP